MLNKLIKLTTLFVLILHLAACATVNSTSNTTTNSSTSSRKTEEPVQLDLTEIRKQADIAYANEDLVTSEKNYEILIKELPEEAEHWFRLGNIYVRTKRPYAAISLYREAVIRDPKFAKAWYNMGIIQLKQTAYSLNEMLIYTDKQDPLYSKATSMLEDIKAIVEEE